MTEELKPFEIVTEEMVEAAVDAYGACRSAFIDDAIRAALEAVAPMIRRAALEAARKSRKSS